MHPSKDTEAILASGGVAGARDWALRVNLGGLAKAITQCWESAQRICSSLCLPNILNPLSAQELRIDASDDLAMVSGL
jgi:hypothetical protein